VVNDSCLLVSFYRSGYALLGSWYANDRFINVHFALWNHIKSGNSVTSKLEFTVRVRIASRSYSGADFALNKCDHARATVLVCGPSKFVQSQFDFDQIEIQIGLDFKLYVCNCNSYPLCHSLSLSSLHIVATQAHFSLHSTL